MTDGVAQGVRILAGRYEIGDLIGRGGMADVHDGRDTRLGRKVAIKLLRPALATDPAFRSRFRREAQDAAKMAHPTIVRIFDAGEETLVDDDGVESQLPFIIMERVDGKALSELIANGPLDPHQAAGIAGQVLTALEYSHRAGLVHRDVKPGNIMITSTGQVKVMDFGIARAISEVSATIAEQSSIVGTAQYFSPEQARGEAIDARADLYSMGIVLFEMLTGRAPFVGENPVAVAYQHVSQQAARPSAVNARVSPALDAVVSRAIAKDRDERYQSASEFSAELTAADAGTVAIKRPAAPAGFESSLFGVNPTSKSGSQSTVRQLSVDDRTRGSRTSQTRPPVAWIWAGIVITIAVVAAVFYWTVNLSSAPTIINNSSVSVPALVDRAWDDTTKAELEDAGLTWTEALSPSDSVAAGTVISTTPGAGVTVAPGDSVRVTISTGQASVTVPTLSNLSLGEATAALAEVGLTVGTVDENNHPSIDNGVVMASTPGNGEAAQPGTAVNLIVSNGTVDIPDVTGQEIGAAVAQLRGSQYQLQVTQSADMTCSGSEVSSQSLTGKQKQHVAIELTYCAGVDAG